MRAMSVLESAKSNRHRKTHRVDPDGTGRKFMHLTRGGLLRESAGEVSRGHSSAEGRESGWSEGPKNQQKAISRRTPGVVARSPAKRIRSGNYGSYRARWGKAGGWILPQPEPRGCERPPWRQEVEEDA